MSIPESAMMLPIRFARSFAPNPTGRILETPSSSSGAAGKPRACQSRKCAMASTSPSPKYSSMILARSLPRWTARRRPGHKDRSRHVLADLVRVPNVIIGTSPPKK